jgi:hypothetical protein
MIESEVLRQIHAHSRRATKQMNIYVSLPVDERAVMEPPLRAMLIEWDRLDALYNQADDDPPTLQRDSRSSYSCLITKACPRRPVCV